MEHRVGRTLRVFLLVLAAAGFHRLTVVPLVEPRVRDQLSVGLRSFDEADVDLEGDHRRDHLAGVADHQPDLARGVGVAPARQQPRQQVGMGIQRPRARTQRGVRCRSRHFFVEAS
jgi:hypothetical protein